MPVLLRHLVAMSRMALNEKGLEIAVRFSQALTLCQGVLPSLEQVPVSIVPSVRQWDTKDTPTRDREVAWPQSETTKQGLREGVCAPILAMWLPLGATRSPEGRIAPCTPLGEGVLHCTQHGSISSRHGRVPNYVSI